MACNRFLFLLLLFSFLSCKEEVKEYAKEQAKVNYNCPEFEYFGPNTYNANASYVHDMVLTYNKQVIPCLIDSIDISRKGFIGFLDPKSSRIPPFFLNNQTGINYAYLIELILSKDSIESVKRTWESDHDFLHWEELVKPYRIYNHCVIVKKDREGYPIPNALTHDDMLVVKWIYSLWWEANKHKSIEVLREERKKGARILKDPYIYIWI